MSIFRCLHWKKLLFVVLSLITGVFLVFIGLFIIFWIRWPELEVVLEMKKCPFCYGTDLCPKFYDNSIQLSQRFLDVLISFIDVKNVYKATYFDAAAVVKKLGHDWELVALDNKIKETICNGNNTSCNLYDRRDWVKQIKTMVNYKENQTTMKNLIVCPNTDGIDFLIDSFYSKTNNYDELTTLTNVWTIFQINAEPVILKFLNMNSDWWPVPKYYGACGRTAVMKYAGTSLFSYHFKDYYHRLEITIKLLAMAFVFTFQHNRFRFYLTDVSTGNIVINDDGHLIVVDLENVIILDKLAQADITNDWLKANHTSEVIPCEGCFGFSTDEICSHYLSDHNIYMFCTLIKEDILYSYIEDPHVEKALSECVNPTHSNRFDAANDFIKKLKYILKVHQDENVMYDKEF